jgi:hypothetical protein
VTLFIAEFIAEHHGSIPRCGANILGPRFFYAAGHPSCELHPKKTRIMSCYNGRSDTTVVTFFVSAHWHVPDGLYVSTHVFLLAPLPLARVHWSYYPKGLVEKSRPGVFKLIPQ